MFALPLIVALRVMVLWLCNLQWLSLTVVLLRLIVVYAVRCVVFITVVRLWNVCASCVGGRIMLMVLVFGYGVTGVHCVVVDVCCVICCELYAWYCCSCGWCLM